MRHFTLVLGSVHIAVRFCVIFLFTCNANFIHDGMFNMHYSHVWTTIIYAEGSSISLFMSGSSINLIRTARSNQIPFLPSESLLWFTGSCSIAAVRAHVLFKREEYRFIAPHKKTKLSECSVFKSMDWSRWIHHWPTISQYFSYLDFFLWENLKSFVHETSIDSPEDIVARISVAVK